MSLAVAKKDAITSTGPSAWRPAVVAIAILLVLAVLPTLVDPYQTRAAHLRPDHGHRGARLQSAARLYRTVVVRPFRLFRRRRLYGCVHRTRPRRQSMELCIVGGLLGTLLISALFGFVCVRHTRIFFSILTLALSQVLWSLAFKFFWVTGGTDGIRVASAKLTLLGGLVNFAGPGSFQRFVFAYYYYVLDCSRWRRSIMWVDRAFAVRQGAAGNSRQRDARELRRHISAALPLDRLRHIGRVHGPGRCPLGSAQWPDHARHPLLAVLRRDRVHERARRLSHVHRADRRRAWCSTISRPMRSRAREYWQLLLGVVLVVLVLVLPSGIVGTAARLAARFTRGTS